MKDMKTTDDFHVDQEFENAVLEQPLRSNDVLEESANIFGYKIQRLFCTLSLPFLPFIIRRLYIPVHSTTRAVQVVRLKISYGYSTFTNNFIFSNKIKD